MTHRLNSWAFMLIAAGILILAYAELGIVKAGVQSE
jgi:hypothetical protein